MTPRKLVVNTDVLLGHLCGSETPSLLRVALQRYFCYTTVVQAAQLFSLAGSRAERKAVDDLLSGIRVLGLHAKIAPRCGALLARGTMSISDALTASVCIASRLPLLTGAAARFKGVAGLLLIPQDRLLRGSRSRRR